MFALVSSYVHQMCRSKACSSDSSNNSNDNSNNNNMIIIIIMITVIIMIAMTITVYSIKGQPKAETIERKYRSI